MPLLSSVSYTATEGQTNFSISFSYIDQEDIIVKVDDVATTAFTFFNASTIALNTGATAGQTVSITRATNSSSRVVDFANGSVLQETALDNSALQLFYLIQELIDDMEQTAQFPDGEAAFTLPSLSTRGGKVLGFSSDGLAFDTTLTVAQIAQAVSGAVSSSTGFSAINGTGDGTADDTAAVTAANATGLPIIVTGNHRISSNLTISSPLIFAGGTLKPDTGVTITLDGMVFGARDQLFDPQGTAIIAAPKLLPEWFGGTTDTQIQAALNGCAAYGAGEVLCESPQYSAGATITVPTDVHLNLAPGSFIQPTANVNVVQISAGSRFTGEIRTETVSGWTATAIYVLGSANFNFAKKTKIEAVLIGGKGTNEGTALQLYAADTSGHRVMNVRAQIEADGFTEGVYIHKDGTALTSFVNANILMGSFSETDRALLMESDHANDFGIDGNKITYSHQPRSGTTKPSATLAGQSQSIECWPYDWDTVAGTSAYAVVMGSAFRTSDVTVYQQVAYIQNNSSDRGNIIRVMDNAGDGGLYASLLESNSADNFLRFRATDPHLENTRGIHFRNAADNGDYKVLSVDANDDVLLRITGAGNNIILDSANQILGRVGGSATWTIDANGRYIWTNGTLYNGFPTHANTADRVWTYPDQSGILALNTSVPSASGDPGVLGEIAFTATHGYAYTSSGWRRWAIGSF